MGWRTGAPSGCWMRLPPRWALRSVFSVASLVIWLWCPCEGLASFELDPVDPLERGSATRLAIEVTGADPAGALQDSAHESLRSFRPGMISFYAFRPFGVREIDFAAASVHVPVGARIQEIAVSYQRLGALSYTEEVYLVSARVAVHAGSVGAGWIEPALRLGAVRSGDMFRDHAWLLDLGAEVRPARTIKAAVRLKNLLGSGLVGEGSRCPTGVTLGAGLAVSSHMGFGVEVEKESGFPICLASGVELRAAGGLALRAGAKTYPREIACGAGLRRGRVALDVGSSLNFELGATHEAGVTLLWR